MLKLIGSYTSPFVRKVRIVLAEKKIEYEFIEENVWADNSQIHQVTPLGKVPCLLLEDNSAIFDSSVIVGFLDAKSPVGRIIPQSGRDKIDVLCWEALGDGICDAAVAILLEKRFHEEPHQSPAWIDRQLKKIHESLLSASVRLGDKKWFYGDNFSLADISMVCALGYLDLRNPELDWRKQFPNLAVKFDQLSERQSIQTTRPPQ